MEPGSGTLPAVPVWLTILIPLLGLVAAALGLWLRWRHSPRPELYVSVRNTGGGSGLDFTITAGNEGSAHAHGVLVRAVLGDQVVHERTINLSAGASVDDVRFAIARPEQGDLIPACNNEPTTYGVPLVVELLHEGRLRASFTWREPEYDPETSRARFEAKLAHWRARGKLTAED